VYWLTALHDDVGDQRTVVRARQGVVRRECAGRELRRRVGRDLRAKPSSSKGRYLKKVVVSPTTGPGIPVDPALTGRR
jgi:hypothetical protein